MSETKTPDEWIDYTFYVDKEIKNYFTKKLTSESKVLYILGDGFDQRMCDGLESLILTNGQFSLDVWKIEYDEGQNSPSKHYSCEKEKNLLKLYELVAENQIIIKKIDMWTEEGNNVRYVGEVNTNKAVINSKGEFEKYTDIILDVSALPMSIYICLLNKVLDLFYETKNIYVVVNENYETDKKTLAVELGEFAHEIHGLSCSATNTDDNTIWFPVLGESNTAVLQKYHDYLNHAPKHVDETCPVLPFPSIDSRRADKIINEYRQQIFGQWEIDKKNILYASEMNPFQIYRELISAARHYEKVLKPLGSCKYFFTNIASKLMTIGTFLAAFDLKKSGYQVGFLNITNRGYEIIESKNNNNIDNKLYCLCLSEHLL